MRSVLLLFAFTVFASSAASAQNAYLYDARFVQAAPGKLPDLIDHYKARLSTYQPIGDEPPLWIRHSQGDKWDLMLLFPMGSYGEYYRADRETKRRQSEQAFAGKFKGLVAWQEDLFVYGPALEKLREAYPRAGFFHLEIFQALPGKHAELYREREMENAYLRALKRPENFIFVRDQGAAWDLFTLGFYRNLKHYAESADISENDQEAAARAAGFEGAARIGPYLRTLIAMHHDTLAVAVK
ncbi:MAG TPA: hypothetical protein VGV87_01525 [Blastocatellia bacterium]|nr:hypothetical protein [Blastocatellia bacterium]